MSTDTQTPVYAIQATYPSGEAHWVTSGNTFPKIAAPYYDRAAAVALAERFTSLAGRTSPTGTAFAVLDHPDPARGRA